MRIVQRLSAASALFIIASASPIELLDFSKAFTVFQSFEKQFILTGPTSILSTYQKFNVQPPADVVSAAANNDGAVSASPTEYDSQYLVPVKVGGQSLNLDFDTGSADLWVFSSELSATDKAGHEIYNPAFSDTSAVKRGYTWRISYGDKSGASGDVYTDTVTVGDTTVKGQAIELASRISPQFQRDTEDDGLFGLSFSSINRVSPVQQPTFFDNAKSSLSAPLFTVDLKKGAPGSYSFGFIDNSKCTGSITYVAVDNSRGFWGFTSNGYAVGTDSFSSTSIKAIADTGTTLLYLPDSVVDDYYDNVPSAYYSSSQGGYVFPCGTTLPSITLGIASYRAVVPGSFVEYAPVTDGSPTCFGGIQSNTGIGFSIFGDTFLKSQFVVFDGSDSPRLGFATKNL